MTCEEARLLIGADPESASPELLAHLQTCAECEAYRQQMLALNAKIRRALELDWHEVRGKTAVLTRRDPAAVTKHRRPRVFALAASFAVALVGVLTLWLSRPAESLAADIVRHVEHEPNSWYKTQPVADDQVATVLRKSGVRLGPGMQSIVYASSCWFRGHFVPHLVVMTQEGPVTVMILLNEKIRTAQQFNEDGFSGLLVPAPAGSVAVLSRAPMSLDQPASNVVKALQSASRP